MSHFAWSQLMLASILWFGLVAGLTSTLQQVTDFGSTPLTSPNVDTGRDVSPLAALTHGGGGDSQGIASMMGYASSTYSTNYAHLLKNTGMMMNVLCAVYPDLWRAATAYYGPAAGRFVSTSSALGA
ncbi:hypothetical protein B0H10DRAFT_2211300 [Mycena sp. CBHHK59/15]|nr:hypothetical protein B0H10DRAFT_2211300 [Mycena sp. CBHHK59/15]